VTELLASRLTGRSPVRSLWITNAIVLSAGADLVAELAARSDVRAIYLDEVVTLEPARTEPILRRDADALARGAARAGGGARAPGDTAEFTYGLIRIKVPELRQVYNLTGSGVKVGVIDTGIDPNHPDLKDKAVAWKDFVASKPDPYDDQGHGTHVCGTIAGGSSSGLAIGVAPQARLMVAKVFTSSGTADTSNILSAMQWIADPDGNPSTADQPALCSNSWGGGPGRKVFLEATQRWVSVGVFPSFAAGNSGPGASTVGTPGGFLEAFGVGATDLNDAIADFSSRGPVTWDERQYTKPDISAPGKAVTSAKAGGGYTALSGTSMATPHISGILALLYQANPSMTIAQARELLERTAQDLGDPGKDNTFGAGRANALAAAQIVVSGGKISGKLTDAATGAGLGGVVSVAENGFSVKTDRQTGAFAMVLPAGTYTLSGKAFGYAEQAGLSVAIGAQEHREVAIKLARAPSGTLSGRVLAAETGEALSAKITVADTPLDPVTTQGSGAFTVQLPAGTYKLLVTSFGYDPVTVEGVAVAAGQTTERELKLTHLPPILVVADDNRKGYEKYVKRALDLLGKKYSVVESSGAAGLMASDFLLQYQVVVWLTGDAYSETLTASDQTNLQAFLDAGGGLFATGQDIGYDIKESSFYASALHAKWLADTVPTKEVSGAGLTFKIEGGDWANTQRYSEQVEALAGGTPLFKYAGDVGPAGIAGQASKGRVVYFAFGYEAIDTEANRQAALKAVLDYLAPGGAAERPARLKLLGDLARVAPRLESARAGAALALTAEIAGMGRADLDAIARAASGAGAGLPRDVRRALNARLIEDRR
jgi:hypothetical protein